MKTNKQKTRKSLSNRIKVTKSGKVLHRPSFGRHLKSQKNKSQIRNYRKMKELGKTLSKKIKKLVPSK